MIVLSRISHRMPIIIKGTICYRKSQWKRSISYLRPQLKEAFSHRRPWQKGGSIPIVGTSGRGLVLIIGSSGRGKTPIVVPNEKRPIIIVGSNGIWLFPSQTPVERGLTKYLQTLERYFLTNHQVLKNKHYFLSKYFQISQTLYMNYTSLRCYKCFSIPLNTSKCYPSSKKSKEF